MPNDYPPLLGLAAFSGVGKTTLLTRLLPLLNARGLRVGVIKFSHHDVEMDHPGKDSYLIRHAGANPVMLASPFRRALITEHKPAQNLSLQQELEAFPRHDVDLLLIEGFRDAAIPKLELHRPSLGHPLLYPNDPNIIAIASDQVLSPPPIPLLDLNDLEQIVEFISALA